MTIAILATGDEIVHGDTLNTNAYALAQAISSEGLSLGFHIACSDKEKDIIQSLQFLTQEHDIILIIGGLGPTTDDRTRFALAQFTGEALVQNPEALLHVETRLHAAKVAMNEGNLQQCLFPLSAKILPNPSGSAVGCVYTWKKKTFFLLPGPPKECLPMFHHSVLPLLQQTKHSSKKIIKWLIYGIAESELGQILEETLQGIDCKTGYRLDVPYIEFKVHCQPELLATVKELVDTTLAKHGITTIPQKASSMLCELLSAQQMPITIIDEATGGLLQTLLVKPDNNHLLDFNNLRKTRFYFHCRGLDEYWQQQPIHGSTQLIIHFRSYDQEGKETHQIPFRSPLVVNYAAEWLSFRLMHLINQLH